MKKILAGIEFDVQIDLGENKCHIITIFDTKDNSDNYNKIKNVLNSHLLKKVDAFYTRPVFEDILKEIGLDVILIACQRSGLDNRSKGKHNSYSESVKNPKELLSIRYINALEFQKPHVEGILKKI